MTLIAAAVLAVLMIAFAPALYAYQGGAGSGNRYYDCGGSCHTRASTATISMSASAIDVSPGEAVTVSVTVSGGQAGNILGIMIISALSPDAGSLPSADGWTITSDPSGSTTYNYYETQSYSGQITMTWTLTAPTIDGVYSLYARVMHGGGSEYAEDDTEGLTFIVGAVVTPGAPTVILTSPTAGATVKSTITVNANVRSQTAIEYVVLRIDGTEAGNWSHAPYAWDVDTATYADGEHTINVTAVDESGGKGYSQVTVTIDNAAAGLALLAWVWTMAAGSVAIVGAIGVLIVLVLAIRKKKIEGRLR